MELTNIHANIINLIEYNQNIVFQFSLKPNLRTQEVTIWIANTGNLD